ncbi:MAG: hypothetical protein A3D52_02870 [Candidatus Taylorbacteria bacterium RIFCSPHIGHO2_02_FULL_44_36]|uniref:Uncharacterized protein n=1 Tax=Candidatus Taylorbacteria bacterium RIFCSPLOWO2_12_FULL_44_15c TaxID=1802333 RepID=A0A1G2P442_9BACT|nr:MAG: hypothetical protein A3D52_02870 [Candidatus Taylorbacteria bacterium RIFCSPHIGHO2_02_FULL_44_36]OHA38759.1 MAG: hypothetical protein A3I97_01670 [Candidatus Taylorbacteria bacterium RIFCSPLOWO2_02_FULL_44_35]OHA43104.1 MAG: hypothetical protein A3G03_02315 [Candidatus Taylorbacteria bacterium RIFCSPLOWO2_12_FULL_44_15c]
MIEELPDGWQERERELYAQMATEDNIAIMKRYQEKFPDEVAFVEELLRNKDFDEALKKAGELSVFVSGLPEVEDRAEAIPRINKLRDKIKAAKYAI